MVTSRRTSPPRSRNAGLEAVWFSPEMARIVDHERGMRAGVTTSVMHNAGFVVAGWTPEDGPYGAPVARSHRLTDMGHIEAVHAVVLALWDRVKEQPPA